MASLCVLLPLAALAFSGCGLPGQQPSLLAPTVPSLYNDPDSGHVFGFDNQSQASPDSFYGFEIYYKFYDNSDGNANNEYNADIGKLNPTATGPTQLINVLHYRRAYFLPPGYSQGTQLTTEETIPPLIPVAFSLRTTNCQVTIDFTGAFSSSSTTTFYPQVEIDGQPVTPAGALTGSVQLARYMANANIITGGGYILEGFGQDDFALDQGDDNGLNPPGDVPSTLIDSVNQQGTSVPQAVLLGLYAIAYGRVELTTDIYSTPTPLGFIRYYRASFSNVSNPQ